MQLLLRKTLAFVVGCLLFYIFSAKTTGDGTACGTDLETSRPASSLQYRFPRENRVCFLDVCHVVLLVVYKNNCRAFICQNT